jgi:hypothetical protein
MARLAFLTLFLVAGLLLTTSAATAPALLEHVARTDAERRRLEPHELRWARARVNPYVLISGFAGAGTPLLMLNLFPEDEPIKAHFVDLESRSRDNFTWYGVIEDDPRSLVLLTAVDGFVDGTVLYRDRMFRLKPTRSGYNRVSEINRLSFSDLGDDVDPPDFRPEPRPFDRRLDVLNKPWFRDLFRVDVLVAFTQQVLFEYGGGIHATIQGNIDMTNINFYASGIAARLRLVHTEPEFYDESANYPLRHIIDNVKDHLDTQNDGLLDEVHAQRDAHAADIVVLLTKWNEACGSYRFFLPPNSPDYKGPSGKANLSTKNPLPHHTKAFAVVDVDCAITNFVFSHEVGHVLGADHDAGASSPPKSPTPYARGYIHISPTAKARSIMAYNTDCEKLQIQCYVSPWYSNPDASHFDGVPFGLPDKADNRRIINELTWYVTGFR